MASAAAVSSRRGQPLTSRKWRLCAGCGYQAKNDHSLSSHQGHCKWFNRPLSLACPVVGCRWVAATQHALRAHLSTSSATSRDGCYRAGDLSPTAVERLLQVPTHAAPSRRLDSMRFEDFVRSSVEEDDAEARSQAEEEEEE